MISKEHLENFLRLNGIPATAPDETIRAALINARWDKQDAEMAVTILRGKEGEPSHIVHSHKRIHSDTGLSSETISSLLGVTVRVNSQELQTPLRDSEKDDPQTHWVLLGALIVATAALLGALHHFQLGPFYVPNDSLIY